MRYVLKTLMNTHFLYKENEEYYLPIFGYDEDGQFGTIDMVAVHDEQIIQEYLDKGLIEEL